MTAWREAAGALGVGLSLATAAAPLLARGDGPGSRLEIGALDIESLLDLSVEAATRGPERAWEAPAAVFVATADDIQRHAFRTLSEILASVPGLFAYPGQFPQVGVRGMGVVGDFTTRLLLMVDRHPPSNSMGADLGRGLLPVSGPELLCADLEFHVKRILFFRIVGEVEGGSWWTTALGLRIACPRRRW